MRRNIPLARLTRHVFAFIIAGTTCAFPATFSDLVRASGLPISQVEIISQIPHDTASFTQGLIYDRGVLFESTGLYGQSSVRKINPSTGEILKTVGLDSTFFGEGLTLCEGKLFQITWREQTALIYRPDRLESIGMFRYDTEGWGLTADGKRLIMTDGTSTLYFRNPTDFSRMSEVTVTLAGRPIQYLNELEFVNGLVYANILNEDYIVEIDPTSGQVTGVVDARSLRDVMPGLDPQYPLNGIAYDHTSGDFYLTGKLWPFIFRVHFVRNLGDK